MAVAGISIVEDGNFDAVLLEHDPRRGGPAVGHTHGIVQCYGTERTGRTLVQNMIVRCQKYIEPIPENGRNQDVGR